MMKPGRAGLLILITEGRCGNLSAFVAAYEMNCQHYARKEQEAIFCQRDLERARPPLSDLSEGGLGGGGTEGA